MVTMLRKCMPGYRWRVCSDDNPTLCSFNAEVQNGQSCTFCCHSVASSSFFFLASSSREILDVNSASSEAWNIRPSVTKTVHLNPWDHCLILCLSVPAHTSCSWFFCWSSACLASVAMASWATCFSLSSLSASSLALFLSCSSSIARRVCASSSAEGRT